MCPLNYDRGKHQRWSRISIASLRDKAFYGQTTEASEIATEFLRNE